MRVTHSLALGHLQQYLEDHSLLLHWGYAEGTGNNITPPPLDICICLTPTKEKCIRKYCLHQTHAAYVVNINVLCKYRENLVDLDQIAPTGSD